MPPRNRHPNGARHVPFGTAVLAALALAAPAQAGIEASARKEAFRGDARAASPARLPLDGAPVQGAVARSHAAEVRALARRGAPARLLIAARAHRHVAELARLARTVGSEVRVHESVGVVAVTASPAALLSRLRGDPRVASIEASRTRRITQEPADRVDPDTGIPFGWAFDAVRAGEGLAAVGGGSSRVVAVIDSGVDVAHPDIRGQVFATFNSADGSTNAFDAVGHGTFVSGLISMDNANGVGGRGVSGRTRIFGIRADDGGGGFTTESLLVANSEAIRRGSDILNLSLGGEGISETEARALALAFLSDVLPVAASGNEGQRGNRIQFPAAAIGGGRGSVGIGLSVAATKPDGLPAPFSSHNDFVSVAAPGSGQQGCDKGVFSTVPSNRNLIFDDPAACARPLTDFGPGRYGYSEGTSFAAPIASGVAALAWQAQPRLASEQVADVVQRSARQTLGGSGWNEFTGHGVVDAASAVQAARIYDVAAPSFRVSRRREGRRFRVRIFRGRDRTLPGDELAGRVSYALAARFRDGRLRFLARPTRRPISRTIVPRRGVVHLAIACDGNGNCGSKRLRLS